MKLKYEGISMESKKFCVAHLINQTWNHETENFTPAKSLNFSLHRTTPFQEFIQFLNQTGHKEREKTHLLKHSWYEALRLAQGEVVPVAAVFLFLIPMKWK